MTPETKAILKQVTSLGFQVMIRPKRGTVEILAIHRLTGERRVTHCADNDEERYKALSLLAQELADRPEK